MISIICSFDSIQKIIILHFSKISFREEENLFIFNLDVSLSKQKTLENSLFRLSNIGFPIFPRPTNPIFEFLFINL